jgi:hypothetical protein
MPNSSGAIDCQVDISATNSWMALALTTPNGASGWASGPTRSDAVNTADSYCRRYGGGGSCHLGVAIDATYIP